MSVPRIMLIVVISLANVDSDASRLSSFDKRVRSAETGRKEAYCAGTNEPIWAMTCRRAIWRSSVDLPLMLGPLMIWNEAASVAYVSLQKQRGALGERCA